MHKNWKKKIYAVSNSPLRDICDQDRNLPKQANMNLKNQCERKTDGKQHDVTVIIIFMQLLFNRRKDKGEKRMFKALAEVKNEFHYLLNKLENKVKHLVLCSNVNSFIF